ncbi:hypothetical protein ABPG75_011748 [Micractinium tetrahymenae]
MEPAQAGTPKPLGAAEPGDHAEGSCAGHEADAASELCTSRENLLARTVAHLGLPEVDLDEVIASWNACKLVQRLAGGQARVYICPWTNSAAASASASRPLISDGQLIAFKHMLLPHGGGNFSAIETEEQFKQAALHGQRALSLELTLLSVIHQKGCGARMIRPLVIIGWPGCFVPDVESRRGNWWERTYGYLMPAYPRGSVDTLLKDVCHRVLPADAPQRYLGMRTLSSEYSTLLGELRRLHTTPGLRLMLQDLTTNNLLVDDSGKEMRLLFADPAMALPIRVLEQPKPRLGHIMGTWLWGSMQARSGRFDPTADLYSLSFVFAEMWLAAEGAAVPVIELIQETRLDADKAQGVRFVRSLIAKVLRSHRNRGSIIPRVKRHLPVSWLGAWALLLGFRDYQSESQMRLGLPCLRPSEEEMLEVAQLWARVCAVAEDLPQDVSEEQARSPACQPLVADMCRLLSRLLQLSRLEAAPEDPDLGWLAVNFMELRHPLVAAMKAQGAAGVGAPEGAFKAKGWAQAVHWAQGACKYAITSEQLTRALIKLNAELEGQRAREAVVWQWYQGTAAQLQPDQLLPEAVAAPMRQTAAAAGVQVVWPLPAAVPATDSQLEPAPAAAPAAAAPAAAAEEEGEQGSSPEIQPSPAAAPAAAAAAAAAEEEGQQGSSQEGAPVLQGWPSLVHEAEQQAQQLLSALWEQMAAGPAAGQKRKAADTGDMPSAQGAVAQVLDGLLGGTSVMLDVCKQAAMHTADAAAAGARAQKPRPLLPATEAQLDGGTSSACCKPAVFLPELAGALPASFKSAPADLPPAASGRTSGSLTATAHLPRRTPASAAVASHRRTLASPAATPPAVAAACETAGPSSKRQRQPRYSAAPASAAVSSLGAGAGLPATVAGPDGIYPWPNAALSKGAGGQGGEKCERWLQRIQPRLVAGIYEAVVPGGGQLEQAWAAVG